MDIPLEYNFEIYDDQFFLYDADIDPKKQFIYYIYFNQNITFDSINFLCSISTKDSSKEFPNLEQKDCNVFQDPDS